MRGWSVGRARAASSCARDCLISAAGLCRAGSGGSAHERRRISEGDPFLARYDGAGDRVWLKQLGSTTDDGAEALATDPDGNVYIAGTIKGQLDGNEYKGGIDMFVLKYDSDGNRL